MKKIIQLFISLLLLVIMSISCDSSMKEENLQIEYSKEQNAKEHIDMSNIDFNNIENLFAQPLPVIQKCLEGQWNLLYSYGGLMGETITDTLGNYIQITKERIIMGNNTGIIIDAPVEWKELENFWGFPVVCYMSCNIRFYDLFPMQIKDGTLIFWDLMYDGYKYYYTKN